MAKNSNFEAKWVGVQKESEDTTEIEKDFLENEENMSRKSVREYAKKIAHSFLESKKDTSNKAENVKLLIDVFHEERMFSPILEKIGFTKGHVDRKVIDSVFSDIRNIIYTELKNELDKDEFIMIEEYLNSKTIYDNLIASVKGERNEDTIVRRMDKLDAYSETLPKEMIENYKKAHKTFSSVDQDKVPASITPEYYFDPESLTIITKKVDLTTFNEEFTIKQNKEAQMINVLLDVIRGAKFIEGQGLVLQDISEYNIGIDNETGKGILFDLDYLYPVGEDCYTVFASANAMLPEYDNKEVEKPIKASTKEMVFQFGKILEPLLNHRRLFNQISEMHKEFVDKMIDQDPANRPGLSEVILTLEAIEEDLKAEKLREKEDAEREKLAI